MLMIIPMLPVFSTNLVDIRILPTPRISVIQTAHAPLLRRDANGRTARAARLEPAVRDGLLDGAVGRVVLEQVASAKATLTGLPP